MKKLTIREMRQSYAVLRETLAEEGEIMLTHHGKAFARITPIDSPKTYRSHARLRETMPFQETSSAALIREDRDER